LSCPAVPLNPFPVPARSDLRKPYTVARLPEAIPKIITQEAMRRAVTVEDFIRGRHDDYSVENLGRVGKVPMKKEGRGWIQWKGTNACIDLYCPCGLQDHMDLDFLYYVKCTGCGQVYSVSPDIKLIPDDSEEAKGRALEMREDNEL
jgi:hypothetical protein